MPRPRILGSLSSLLLLMIITTAMADDPLLVRRGMLPPPQPTIFPRSEFPIAEPEYGPAYGNQSAPQVATDGEDFLVVWYDGRVGREAIFGARVTDRGESLDPLGFVIHVAVLGAGVREIAVRWVGDAYVVLWQEQGTRSMYFVRIDPARGMVEGKAKLLLPNAYANARSVAWNGTHMLVAYQRESGLLLALLNRHGELVQGDIRLPGGERNAYGAAAASNGSGFFVAWQASFGRDVRIFGAAVDSSGMPPTSVLSLAPDPAAIDLAIASDGMDYLVTWNDVRPVSRMRMIHVDSSNDVVAPGHSFTANGILTMPNIAWRGDSYLIITQVTPLGGSLHIAGVRVDRRGAPLDLAPTVFSLAEVAFVSPAVVSNGLSDLVVWQQGQYPIGDIVGVLNNSPGTSRATEEPFLISRSATAQWSPAIASGRNLYLTVWTETTEDGTSQIFAARFDGSGTLLDGRGIRLSRSPGYFADVTFDGANFLAAWLDSALEGPLWLTRISPEGKILVQDPVQITSRACGVPALASDGSFSLLVWPECSQGWPSRIFASRIEREGPPTMPVQISFGRDPEQNPNLAWNGSSYFAVWEEQVPVYCPGPLGCVRRKVWGVRLSKAGEPTERSVLVSREDGDTGNPSIASSGHEFLVAWQREGKIRGRRFRAAESIEFLDSAEGVQISADQPLQQRPRVISVGSKYLVTWQARTPTTSYDVIGSYVPRVEAPNPEAVFTISATELDDAEAAPVASSNGSVAVVYRRVALNEYGGVNRIFGRFLRLSRARPSRVR